MWPFLRSVLFKKFFLPAYLVTSSLPAKKLPSLLIKSNGSRDFTCRGSLRWRPSLGPIISWSIMWILAEIENKLLKIYSKVFFRYLEIKTKPRNKDLRKVIWYREKSKIYLWWKFFFIYFDEANTNQHFNRKVWVSSLDFPVRKR